MQISAKRTAEMVPANVGWTYPGVIILTPFIMMVVMALDILINGNIGLISDLGMLVGGITAALRVRTADYQSGIWITPLAWVISLLTVGQLAPMRGGSFLREQILHFSYGLAMHAWWILGATALSAAISIFRRGRRP
ncbi:MAG: hypothetical protein K9F97_05390 [Candidatus Nanopelagicales bacterium]|nr:hypothetical protein [Candidatus Nanopelagicales bacterium]